MELIENLPYGLVACCLNGEQFTVAGLSDRLLRLRLDRPVEPLSLRLLFLRFREARWTELFPENWRVTVCAESRLGWDMTIALDDGHYRAEVLRALGEYADYIRLKTEADDGELAEELTGMPQCGDTAESFDTQKRAWFTVPTEYPVPENVELALSLDRPDAYERFLTMPFPEFQRVFFRRSHLLSHPLFIRSAGRIYLGNSCCFRLFPERLTELLNRCAAQGLKATVVLPTVRESRRDDLDAILSVLADSPADEIAANDWGTLTLLGSVGKAILLGQQLNRRRKDPRLAYKLGYRRDAHLLEENSLNDPVFARFMRDLGVGRYEYEACPGPVTVAAGRHSLHLPFYQTNTSHACPLAAACEGRDPGLPREERDCAMPCLSRALLYPDELGLVGRYNSLFGVNRDILRDGEALQSWLRQGIDRVVAELL